MGALGEVQLRLGLVSRLVIVASSFWMVGGTYFIAKARSDKGTAAANAFYRQCTSGPYHPEYHCSAGWLKIYNMYTGYSAWRLFGYSAELAAAYLALALILFAAVYGSIRWVLAGRASASKP